MALKIEAEYGIREILSSGHGMKIALRDREAFISIERVLDGFEIDGGMRDLNSK